MPPAPDHTPLTPLPTHTPLRAALLRAIEVVKSGKPALIDTVTRHR
jgi:hypothetical protein